MLIEVSFRSIRILWVLLDHGSFVHCAWVNYNFVCYYSSRFL